jgi:hypothetical protein
VSQDAGSAARHEDGPHAHQGTDVGVRHPDALRVAAGEATDGVRVAEAAAGALAPQPLGDAGVGVAVVAQGVELLLAVPAGAAGDEGLDDDAVADPAVPDALADLDDLPHELVAEDVAGPA